MAWDTIASINRNDHAHCFNEAQANWLGILHRYMQGIAVLRVASMRPKPIGLGYYPQRQAAPPSDEGASMRPKPIGLGYLYALCEAGERHTRFNEAQANWLGIPRRRRRSQPMNRRFNEAQANWLGIREEGAADDAPEGDDASMRPKPIGLGYTSVRHCPRPRSLPASMRPKPIGLGYGRPGRRRGAGSQCFNEAQANWLGIRASENYDVLNLDGLQ